MTVHSSVLPALRRFYADAFHEGSPHTCAAPRRSVVVHDVMTTLEPSSSDLGRISRHEQSARELELGRELTPDEIYSLPAQTWQEYAEKRVRLVREAFRASHVHHYVAVFDRGSHPMKAIEHERRYASEEVASDEEVESALRAPTLPREWRRHRAAPRFRRALLERVAEALERMELPERRTLIVVGAPHHEDSRVPWRRQRRDGVYHVGHVQDPDVVLDYFEADFAVVHWATVYARLHYDVYVRAVDGDTLLSLLMNAPRHADVAALERLESGERVEEDALWHQHVMMWRECGRTSTLIDVVHMYALVMDDAREHELSSHSPVETLCALAMMCGNDYALSFTPQVKFATLHPASLEYALSHDLVHATSPLELARSLRVEHVVAVDRERFHDFLVHAYARRYRCEPNVDVLRASPRISFPSEETIDHACAVLRYTMNYFANEPLVHVTLGSVFERRRHRSLHGFTRESGRTQHDRVVAQ